jgi:type I restriction enzyme, S subunit
MNRAEFSEGEDMSEWKEHQLNEVYNFASGLSKSREEFGFGFPFLSFKEVFHNYFLPKNLESLVNTTEIERQRCSVKRGDVFLTRTSETQEELGMSSVALIDYPDTAFNGFTKRLRPNGLVEAHPEYVGYYFRSPIFRATITSMASMTTRASLNNEMMAALKIVLPPLPEQKAIASILSSLDDKIDLLHRQNKTLEAIAETLFRQWFVEDVGKDWVEGKIMDLFVLQRGFDLPSQNRIDGKYPIFAASGFSGGHHEYRIAAPGVTTGRSGLLGKVFFVLDDFWPLNTSLFIKEFKIGTPLFSYFMLKTIDLESFNAGSAVPTLNRNHLHNLILPIPPKDLINDFEMKMMPNFVRIKSNQIQIGTLEKLRDTLLPKLMSGEVRVEI